MSGVSQRSMPRPEPGRGEISGSRTDWVLRGGFIVSVALLTFVAGAVLVASKTFPGPQLADAYAGGQALYTKLTGYDDPYSTDLWKPERTPRKGVTVYDPA